MNVKSAGILLFRIKSNLPEVFLVHPGGPFWQKKDSGVWSIPKGEFTNEDPLQAAQREFKEETGTDITGKFIELSPVRLKSGKTVFGWALQGDIDPAVVKSNLFELEWPYKSGKKQSFPEIDKAAWFSLDKAKVKINSGQLGLIEQLVKILSDT